MGCPLHLLGGLHPKADMGDAVAQAALTVLLLHHDYSTKIHPIFQSIYARISGVGVENCITR